VKRETVNPSRLVGGFNLKKFTKASRADFGVLERICAVAGPREAIEPTPTAISFLL
jgi:hypothetical protein